MRGPRETVLCDLPECADALEQRFGNNIEDAVKGIEKEIRRRRPDRRRLRFSRARIALWIGGENSHIAREHHLPLDGIDIFDPLFPRQGAAAEQPLIFPTNRKQFFFQTNLGREWAASESAE